MSEESKKPTSTRVTTTFLVNRILDFCQLYSNRKFYPYQEQFAKRIIRSALENDGEEITALFSRQAGKSECVAVTSGGMMIILPVLANLPAFAGDKRLEMYKDGMTIGIFAPSERQAKLTYSKIKNFIQSKTSIEILNSPEFNIGFSTSNGQTVALTNGSFVTAISASDGSNIEGESFKMIICEEAQDISNYKITKSIRPMGAAYNATTIDIGTATTYKGYFYDVIQRNKLFSEGKSSFVKTHFEYDYQVASKYNKNYARYVEKEKLRLGENSDAFRMSYKLEWIIERGMFIDINLFEKFNTEPTLERVDSDLKATHVAGIDVGGKGDSTVITITEINWDVPVVMESKVNENGEEEVYEVYNTYVKDWLEIKGVPDMEEQYNIIMDYLKNFNIVRLVGDATREKSLLDRIKANVPYEVVPFYFTLKAKSELYKHLDAEITSGRARICAGESTRNSYEYREFLRQLSELEKTYKGTNLCVSHPTARGAHDDYADSWALSVWGCKGRPTINNARVSDNVFYGRSRSNSKSIYGSSKRGVATYTAPRRRR